MRRLSPLLLAVLFPLAAAPVAQGSAVDDILPSDALAGLEKIVSDGSSTCPESDKKADKKADPLDLVVDDATPCPEDDKQKAGVSDVIAKAGARDAAPADRKARGAQAATPPAPPVEDDPSLSEEPADAGGASDGAVTGVAAQNEDEDVDDSDLTLDEDNDLTLAQEEDDNMLEDDDVGVDEDGDITVEEDDDDSLPRTGMTVGIPALLGSLLLGGGVSLRRRMRRRDS